jgi:hypothetical protein
MSQTGEAIMTVVVIASLTRFDLFIVIFYRLLSFFKLTD